ncbi:MAG: DUF1697 domain-containing protein [Saprospiraceae bacterium]|nr:DUF1697 domain-containing protein [Saprospiraceae bacterium]
MNYIAFLRGINVGGHHKVPMAELREELGKVGCQNPVTILNSGNIIFDTNGENLKTIEEQIEQHLETYFGFSIPTIIRRSSTLIDLYRSEPFQDIHLTKETRLYISFLKKEVNSELTLPWTSDDGSYCILQQSDGNVLSTLDLSVSKTPKAMEALEQFYGKEITTRNWKSIGRIEKKISVSSQ